MTNSGFILLDDNKFLLLNYNNQFSFSKSDGHCYYSTKSQFIEDTGIYGCTFKVIKYPIMYLNHLWYVAKIIRKHKDFHYNSNCNFMSYFQILFIHSSQFSYLKLIQLIISTLSSELKVIDCFISEKKRKRIYKHMYSNLYYNINSFKTLDLHSSIRIDEMINCFVEDEIDHDIVRSVILNSKERKIEINSNRMRLVS